MKAFENALKKVGIENEHANNIPSKPIETVDVTKLDFAQARKIFNAAPRDTVWHEKDPIIRMLFGGDLRKADEERAQRDKL